MQASFPSLAKINDNNRNRVGSDNALNDRASTSDSAASSTLPVTLEQQPCVATIDEERPARAVSAEVTETASHTH